MSACRSAPGSSSAMPPSCRHWLARIVLLSTSYERVQAMRRLAILDRRRGGAGIGNRIRADAEGRQGARHRLPAASVRACTASPRPTTRATGAVSTSISAARSRLPSSTTPARSNTFLCPPSNAFRRSNRARSTSCRAIPPGRCRARPRSELKFAAVTYYDGQGFLVRAALKVESALELGGKSVCTQAGTTTELNLAEYFRSNRMNYQLAAFPTAEEIAEGLRVRVAAPC